MSDDCAISLSEFVKKCEDNEIDIDQIPQELVDKHGYPCLANSLMLKEPQIPEFKKDIAEYIKNNQFETIELLIAYINQQENDIDKLFAIFAYAALNIEYDVELYFSDRDKSTTLEEVFKTKKAVCTGYATFFLEMSKRVNIDTNRIKIKRYDNYSKGFSFNPLTPPEIIKANHSSIYVEIDEIPFISEPTWASGYLTEKHEFQPNFQPDYFLIPLNKSLCSHFPCDESKKLLKIHYNFNDFYQSIKIRPFGRQIKTENFPGILIHSQFGQVERTFSCVGPIDDIIFKYYIKKDNEFEEIQTDGLTSYEIISKSLPKHRERCRFKVYNLFPKVGFYMVEMYLDGIETVTYYANNLKEFSGSIPIQYNSFHSTKFIPISPSTLHCNVRSGVIIRYAVSKANSNLMLEAFKLKKNSFIEDELVEDLKYDFVKLEIPFDRSRYEVQVSFFPPSNGQYKVNLYLENENKKGNHSLYTSYFFDATEVEPNKYVSHPIYYMCKCRKFSPYDSFYNDNKLNMYPSQCCYAVNNRQQTLSFKTNSIDDQLSFQLMHNDDVVSFPAAKKLDDDFVQINFSIPDVFGQYFLYGWVNHVQFIKLPFIYGDKLFNGKEEENEEKLLNKLKERINQDEAFDKKLINYNDAESENELLKKIIEHLNKENDELKTAINKSSNELTHIQNNYKELKRENETFKNENKNLLTNIDQLKNNNGKLITEKEEKIRQLEKNIENIEITNLNLNLINEQLDKDIEIIKNNCKIAEGQIEQLTKENASSKLKIDQLSIDLNQKINEVSFLSKANETIKTHNLNLQSKINQIANENEKIKSAKEKFLIINEEKTKKLKYENENLKKENLEIKIENKNSSNEINLLKDEVARLKFVIEKLKKDIDGFNAKRKEEKNEYMLSIQSNSKANDQKFGSNTQKQRLPVSTASKAQSLAPTKQKQQESTSTVSEAHGIFPTEQKQQLPASTVSKTQTSTSAVSRKQEPPSTEQKQQVSTSTTPKTQAPVSAAPKTQAPVSTTPKTQAPVSTTPKAQAPVSAAPKTQAPVSATPKTQAPVSAAPKTQAPVSAAPKTQAPVSTTPKTQAPVSATPKTQAPVSAAPKTQAPVSTTPKTQAPVSTTPKTQAPVSAAPKTQAPVSATPKTQAPVSTTPKTQAPVSAAPKTQAPVSTTPKTQAPVSTTPKTQAPVSATPKTQAPVSTTPKTQAPVSATPKTQAPVSATPKTQAPVSTTPKTQAPVSTTPKTQAPVSTTPKTQAPVSTDQKQQIPDSTFSIAHSSISTVSKQAIVPEEPKQRAPSSTVPRLQNTTSEASKSPASVPARAPAASKTQSPVPGEPPAPTSALSKPQAPTLTISMAQASKSAEQKQPAHIPAASKPQSSAPGEKKQQASTSAASNRHALHAQMSASTSPAQQSNNSSKSPLISVNITKTKTVTLRAAENKSKSTYSKSFFFTSNSSISTRSSTISRNHQKSDKTRRK